MALLDDPLQASLFGRILESVQLAIQEMVGGAFPDIPKDRIVVRKKPWDKNVELPFCIVSEYRSRITQRTNEQDSWDIGVMIAIAAANEQASLTTGLGTELLWHESVILRFHNRRDWVGSLPEGSCFVNTTVEDGSTHLPQGFPYLLDAQFVWLRCRVSRQRKLA